MVGICHLTDSHHNHHGQKPTMVGICHGGNMLGNLMIMMLDLMMVLILTIILVDFMMVMIMKIILMMIFMMIMIRMVSLMIMLMVIMKRKL